jgi:ribosomal protein L37AE/L43A
MTDNNYNINLISINESENKINNENENEIKNFNYKCKKCNIDFSTDKKYKASIKLCDFCYSDYTKTRYKNMSEEKKELKKQKQKILDYKRNNYILCPICEKFYKLEFEEKHNSGKKHKFFNIMIKLNDNNITNDRIKNDYNYLIYSN